MKNTTKITTDEQIANRRAYHKAWRLKNKEKSKEIYQLNKEKIKEKRKEYYLLNKEKIDKKRKEYYQLNKEKIDKKVKEYRLKRKASGLDFPSNRSLWRNAWYHKNKEAISARRKGKRNRKEEVAKNREYRAKKEAIDPSFFVTYNASYYEKNKESIKMKRKMKRDKVKFSSQEQTSSMKNKPKKLVCDMCENEIEDYAIWEAQQLAEWGFYMHIVIDADYENSPSGFNAHTHGMDHLNHPDFQITISIGQDVMSAIFHNLCAKVKKGMRFKDGDILDNVIGGGFKVRLSTATECGNEVLRVILPDLNGNILPTDIDNNYGSAQYDNFSSQD